MARWVRLLIWTAVLGWGSPVWAADLTKIDRTIARLPQFKTAAPEYCLLVFGPEADARVWLVRDGDVLYVDRNGNGDLTEPGERVEADLNTSHPDEDQFIFKCGNLRVGGLEHKDLVIYRRKLDYLRDSVSKVRDLLDHDPAARGHSMRLDVELPGRQGPGIGGRVQHLVSITDVEGALRFAARPEDAPVLRFGGSWQILLTAEEDKFKVGQKRPVYLAVGTRGLGPGTTTYIAYEGVIPSELNATLTFTLPAHSGEPAQVKSYVLSPRCCTINLYGDVAMPENAATGSAEVEVSLPAWPGTTIASSKYPVTILPNESPRGLEPISKRLKGRLPHTNPTGNLCHIQFSPDGSRLIAGDYPGGVVHVWDIASGGRLATFETGKGLRGSMEYFAVSPDWQTVYAPHAGKSQYERIERDGKVLNRATYDDEIRVWDLKSGELRQTLKHSPPRRIAVLRLAPDGQHFLTIDDLPGEFEAERSREVSLWDAATGTPTDVSTGDLFSPDGKVVAAVVSKAGDNTYCDTIRLFRVSPWQETASIALPEGLVIVYLSKFCPAGNVLVGRVNRYEKRDDYQNFDMSLVLWDTATGKELLSLPARDKKSAFSWVDASPGGRFVAACGYNPKDGCGLLYLVNVAERTTRTVDFGNDAFVFEPVFHPGGRWLAVPVQRLPKDAFGPAEPPPEELAQPQIQIVDVESGRILETIVSPQAYVTSATISPDGKTLATSGQGEVLLWDVAAVGRESR